MFTINIDCLNDTEKKVSDEPEAIEAIAGRLPIVLNTSSDRREDYVEEDEITDVNEASYHGEPPENASYIELPQSTSAQPDIQQRFNTASENNGHTSRIQRVLQAPKWIPDNDALLCMNCAVPFHSFFRRRHHCRNCGGVFCNICSSLCTPLPKYGLYKAVRVCKDCFTSETKNTK